MGEVDEATRVGDTLPERARRAADQWMARQSADPSFVVVALEFLAHAWRNPELREAFATRAAAVRLAIGRLIEEETRAAGLELPMTAGELATVMRELGVGLAVAKLADPAAFSDRLYGDFVQLFFELALKDQPLDRSRSRRRQTASSPNGP